jgi:hypothetical protein
VNFEVPVDSPKLVLLFSTLTSLIAGPCLTFTPVLSNSTHFGSVASFFTSTLILYVPTSKSVIS